ncbi:MAG: aminoglycoside phosphotransferase family protein [Deltaproteobacteria bacterium]|jgi:Ser/Thr protein kinase RdoA (MazF antagonist)|nr:aminoglycoside phosphotransferase family protein [Deltaproteobacteria bacterium]MDL1988879.1 aminoglycoside phosphotransferase family protein [Deltaproteobacteria bacterium]
MIDKLINIPIKIDALKKYLEERFSEKIEILGVKKLGSFTDTIKKLGYGDTFLVTFRKEGKDRSVVFSTMRKDKYGHQYLWDRANVLMFQYDAGQRLPKHAHPLDVGYFNPEGTAHSVRNANIFFLLTEKVEGTDYFLDLKRLKNETLTDLDIERVKALGEYLAEIHSEKKDEPDLYTRKVRELLGHGECIMGIVDGYPENYEFFSDAAFCDIEKRCVEWRWKLKQYTHRLCREHGDFHPWNIKFREGTDFSTFDRSRGEYGEAADDVSTLSINYLLYSLLKYGKLDGEYKKLHDIFIETYLEKTKDQEIFKVIQPFYAFRCLVIASPEWYPNHPADVRKKLFNFTRNILATDTVNIDEINKYLK